MDTATAHSNKSTTVRKPVVPTWLRSGLQVADRVAPSWTDRWLRKMYFSPARMKVTPGQQQVLNEGTRFTFDSQGEAVVAHAWGDSNKAVWLVHGWAGNLGQLTVLVKPLLEQGFRVIGFDWPGHGASSGSVASLLHTRTAMMKLHALVGQPWGVVAHSFGASATTLCMAAGLGAERLAFIAPAIKLQPYVDTFSLAMGLSPSQKSRFVKSSEAWLKAPFSDFEPMKVVPTLSAPLLIAHSVDDREAPFSDAEQLAQTWSGATLQSYEKLGHRRILNEAKVIDETVAHLQVTTSWASLSDWRRWGPRRSRLVG